MNVDAFQRSQVCRYLSRDEAEQLLDLGAIVHLERDDMLFREGDPGDTLYVILEGQIQVVAQLESGARKSLAVLDYGDVIGEAAMIDREPRSAAAVSVGTSRLWEMNRSQLIRLIRKHPQIAAKFMWSLMESLTARMRSANVTQSQLLQKIKVMSHSGLD